jgi:hypothetical protein
MERKEWYVHFLKDQGTCHDEIPISVELAFRICTPEIRTK